MLLCTRVILILTTKFNLSDPELVVFHDVFDVVTKLAKSVGQCISEVHFIVRLLESVIEAKLVVLLFTTHGPLNANSIIR